MKPKTILIQLAIIIASLASSVVLVSWLTDSPFFGKKVLDINLNDTYFVISLPWQLVITPGLILIIVIYLFKETYNHFKYRVQNLILFTAVLLLNVIVFKITEAIGNISTKPVAGWAAYPPLSAQVLHIIQIILIIILIAVTILTVRNWNSNRRSS